LPGSERFFSGHPLSHLLGVAARLFDNPNFFDILVLLSDVLLKRLAAGAFSPSELEVVLRDGAFRLIYDSGNGGDEVFQSLCKRGQDLLAGRDAPVDGLSGALKKHLSK
jgi:hypothetical protein